MKIELKHVAPYLPYGLKNVKAFHTPKEITGIIGSQVFFGDSSLFLIQIQPLLNPLSDVYIGTGGELMAKYNCSLNVIHEMWKLIQGDIELEDVSYRTYLMMCRNHIDFNRLIEAGLAIDKNTLNK